MPEQMPLTWTDVDPMTCSFRWWYDELAEVVEGTKEHWLSVQWSEILPEYDELVEVVEVEAEDDDSID